jgi:SulP family sulfate permease
MMQIKSFRYNLQELGGALGDLGVLLPLTIALITLNHMNATSVFLVIGLAYIIAGVFYRLPVPVQPFKAVAAIAIAGGLSPSVISASGLLMAVILLLIAWTGAIRHVAKVFPKVIIRGIQLGVGLILLKTGLLLVSNKQVIIGGDEGITTLVNLSIPTGWLIALALGIIFILFLRSKRLPASLVVLTIGVPVGIFWGSFLGLPSLQFGLSLPAVAIPSMADLSTALVLLVIPQIPLTLGNAVFATADTAQAYFGPQAKRVTPRALLTTMGVVNMGAGLLGGMPICHGSGGLTAHFRLGARTGGAALLIGVPLLAMALFLDGNVVPIFSLIPYAVLGVLVIFVGVQHSFLIRDLRGKREVLVALAVAIPGLLTANLAIGLASGMGLHFILKGLSRSYAIRSRLWLMARRKVGLVPGSTGRTSSVSSGASRSSSSH